MNSTSVSDTSTDFLTTEQTPFLAYAHCEKVQLQSTLTSPRIHFTPTTSPVTVKGENDLDAYIVAAAETTPPFIPTTPEEIRLAQADDEFCYTIHARIVEGDRVLFAHRDKEILFCFKDGFAQAVILRSLMRRVLHMSHRAEAAGYSGGCSCTNYCVGVSSGPKCQWTATRRCEAVLDAPRTGRAFGRTEKERICSQRRRH